MRVGGMRQFIARTRLCFSSSLLSTFSASNTERTLTLLNYLIFHPGTWWTA